MTIEIPLTKGFVALIDDEDFALVGHKKWQALVTPHTVYVVHKYRDKIERRNRTLYLHREILGIGHLGRKARGDHRDGNGLNNRRANLRLATISQNNGNRRASRDGHKGVRECRGYLMAFLGRQYIGSFRTVEDAARAYDAAARVRFGEFACLNFPGPGERSALTGEIMPLEVAA